MSVRLILGVTVTAALLVYVKGSEEYNPSPNGVRVIRNVAEDQSLNETDNPKFFHDTLTSKFILPLSTLSRLCRNYVNGLSSSDNDDSDSSSSSSSFDDCQGFSVYEPANTNSANNLGSLIHQLNNHGVKIPNQHPNNNGGSYETDGYGTNNENYAPDNNYQSGGYYVNNGNGYANTNEKPYVDDSSSESSADSGDKNSKYNNNGGGYVKKRKGSHTTVDVGVNVHVLSAFFKDSDSKKILADYEETRLDSDDAAKKFINSQNYNNRPPKCLHRGLNALRLLEEVKLTDEGRFLGFSPSTHCIPYINALRESKMQKGF